MAADAEEGRHLVIVVDLGCADRGAEDEKLVRGLKRQGVRVKEWWM